MSEKQSGPVPERANEPQILFLTLAEVDDRSFGGAIRSNDMRDALQQAGHVDTLVIHGASRFALDAAWDERRVKHATFGRGGLSLIALGQRRQIQAWVERTLAAKHYDVIVARYLGLALFVQLKHCGRLVLDADDIFKTPPASAAGSHLVRLKFALRNGVAAVLLRLARHVWVVNPRDGGRLPSRRTSKLPNAISLPALNPTRAPAVGGRVLMVGYFEHPPNAEGLQWFVERVLPSLAVRFPCIELHAIGKHPPQFAERFSGPVSIRGFVDDLAKEYERAALVIAPIRSGGGTQIKVLEALAHGRPLVSSRFAHAGFAEHLVDEDHLLVADAEAHWIDACVRILGHPTESESLAARGLAAVRSHYGVEQMTRAIRQTIDDVVSRR